MSAFLILAFLFAVGASFGWCIEVLYRRFAKANKSRRWINPGFLTGPCLPLYGFGLTVLYLLARIEDTAFAGEVSAGSKLLLFLTMAVAMTVLEYAAGLIFIKGMKLKLWDYSKERFNLQGIICLKFSIYWAVLGEVYYFLIHPKVVDAVAWFSSTLTATFFLGIFYGVFAVDLGYSFGVVRKIRAFAKESGILVFYEDLKLQIRQSAAESMQKKHWLLQFRSEVPLKEHLLKHAELQKAFVEDALKNLKKA